VSLLMRSNLDPLSAGALWLPLLAILGVPLYRARCESAQLNESLFAETLAAGLAGLGFGLITLGWLIPLGMAIGFDHLPVGLFLGAVDQASIGSPLAPFTVGMRVLLLVAI